MLLRRLRLRPPTQLALPAHSPHRTLNFDAYLLQLQRQGYLLRTHIGGAGGTSQKRARGRPGGATQQGSGGGEDNDVAWEWRWGPRAMAEIGEAAIARFVGEFMAERASGGGGGGGGSGSGGRATAGNGGGDGEASDDEVGGRGARARREDAKRRLATLMRGVELAAGGDLSGVTT
jgi:melanoma-associated antigen